MNNSMELKFSALSENESFARAAVAGFCLHLNPSIDELTDIKTAVSEAVTNCVVHAYPNSCGNIVIKVELFDDTIHIEIRDYGVGIKDLKKARTPFFTTKPLEERSGMGFTVMESFMDSLDIQNAKDCGLIVKMSKTIKQAESNIRQLG